MKVVDSIIQLVPSSVCHKQKHENNTDLQVNVKLMAGWWMNQAQNMMVACVADN